MIMKAKIEIFSSFTCPHCPSAINLVEQVSKERNDIEIIKHEINTPEGHKRATELGIMSVPTIIIKGPNNPEFIGLKGLFSEKGLNKAIDVSLGKDNFKENSNLFNKIKNLF
jgi:thioredoxin 1